MNDAVAGRGGGGRVATGGLHSQLTAMHSLATQIFRELHDALKLAQVADRDFAILSRNVRRLAIAPAQLVGCCAKGTCCNRGQ